MTVAIGLAQVRYVLCASVEYACRHEMPSRINLAPLASENFQ